MAQVHIINPTYSKSTKTLRERLGKFKHRPVFYSKSPGKLGDRSEFKKLNPKKRSVSQMAAKKKTKYRAKKRSNPQRSSKPVVKYKYRYKPMFRKAKKRRNPESGSVISASSVAHTVGGGVAGAVAFKVVSGLFQTEGNGKYLLALALAFGGGWLLSKFYRPLASPFAAGVAGIAAAEYLSENDVLSGLLGSSFSNQDAGVLQEWRSGYDTGMLGMAVPDNGQAVSMAPTAMYDMVAGGGGDKL